VGYAWILTNGKYIPVAEEDIGNATVDTDVSYPFQFLNDGRSDPFSKTLPFQVQIQYTRPDRYKCLRTVNLSKPVTRIRAEAYQHSDVAVIGIHTIQSCGTLAATDVDGMREAHKKLFLCKKYLEEVTKNNNASSKEEFANFMKFAVPLDVQLSKKKDDDDEAAKLFYRMKVISKNEFLSGARKTEVVNRRTKMFNDQLSQMYYDYKF